MKIFSKSLIFSLLLSASCVSMAQVGDFNQLTSATIIDRTLGTSIAEQENPLPFQAYTHGNQRMWLRGEHLPALGFQEHLLYALDAPSANAYAEDQNNDYVLIDSRTGHDLTWNQIAQKFSNQGVETWKLYTADQFIPGERGEPWVDSDEGYDVVKIPKALLRTQKFPILASSQRANWLVFETLQQPQVIGNFTIPAGRVEGGGWTKVLVQQGLQSKYYFYPAGATVPAKVLVDERHPAPLPVYEAKDRTLYVSVEAPIAWMLKKYKVVGDSDLDTVVLGAKGADLTPKGYYVNHAKEYYSFYKNGLGDAAPGYKKLDFGVDATTYSYAKVDFTPWLISTDDVNHTLLIDVSK